MRPAQLRVSVSQWFVVHHHRRRAGFTLLEVIFALGLSLLLFAAILSAVEMYRQVSSAGREQVERAQLQRAILRSMEIDIRSVLFYEAEEDEEVEPTLDTEEDAAEEEEVLVETIDAAETFAGQSAGIFGDSATIVIHAGRPPWKLESLLPVEPAGDLKSIAYFLAAPGAEGLPGAAGQFLESAGSGQAQGLARLEGDRMAVEFADQSSDLALLAEQTKLLAGEVDYLQFRYFDGAIWHEAWDSTAYERLPNAVEITIGIGSQEGGMGEVRTSRLRRFVVALPTAAPVLETEDQAF